MKHFEVALLLVASGLVLASCKSSGNALSSGKPTVGLSPKPADPNRIDGKWLPTDEGAKGVYVAEFRSGQFVSRSPKTNQPLAKGQYKVVSADSVELNFVGAATKTAVSAKCQRPTPSKLYCVPSIGSPFNLQKT